MYCRRSFGKEVEQMFCFILFENSPKNELNLSCYKYLFYITIRGKHWT